MIEKEKTYQELTQSQLSLWTGQRLNPEVPMYNMAHSFDIIGAIDSNYFQKAFQELIDRVDALRTVFSEKDGIPVQQVLANVAYSLKVLDFSFENEETVQNWMKRRSQKTFDLSAPLFDSVLIKVDAERHIWFLNAHHLITDATSSVLLYDIMSDLYAHFVLGTAEDMMEIPSFASYVAYESQQGESELKETIQTYWNTKISSLQNSPELYGNKNLKSTTNAKRVSLKLGVERSDRLRSLAQKPEIRSWTQDLTLFNLFTTTLFTFLYRVSGQKKLVIGAPSHNRQTKNFKKTPGLFVEVFPLTTEFEENDTFFNVLERVKLETSDYLRYAQPGMSTAQISRSFEVVLNYIKTTYADFNGMPMKSEWIHPDHCDPGHQLRCHVYDMDASGDIEVHFDLNTDVFGKELIETLPNHFVTLLDALIADINQPIARPSLLSDQEVSAFLTTEETTRAEFKPIIGQFENQVARTPSAIALRFKDTAFTYDELNRKANQLARLLNAKGIGPGKRASLYLERSPEYVIGVLAILKTGGTFITIPSDQAAQRVSYILKDSDSSLVLTSKVLLENISLDTIESITLDLESKYIINQENSNIPFSFSKDDIAYMIYTSGSTGKPKGVLISHASIANYLDWAKEAYRTKDPFVFPLFTSIGFDLTITSTLLPMLTGGEVVVYKEANQSHDISLMEVLADDKVNSIKLTPSHLALLRGMNLKHSKIETMIVGGEDFKTSLATTIQQSFGEKLRIYNEYGPTEATVGCIVAEFDLEKHQNKSSVPIGKPIENMQAYILDTHKNLVPDGVKGELYLSGIGLAKGYTKSELTKEKFIENPFISGSKMYRTGDVARINMQGEIEYLGRSDSQVKLRGYRIELSDIEANLLGHEAIENNAVVLIENEKRVPEDEVTNCTDCGLPSNYPNTDFDENGVCHICNAFKGYKDKTQRYFKTEDELREILISQRGENPNYDCISLLSGGKDSTYILAQLVNMGLKVLAFTLDNGYISEQAKANIDKIVTKLEVDHIYGSTEHMNKIFVDSLHRHQNVCNGCFKTIYTLSTQIALEKKIPFVVTGLSRGQFFETRLTEELFWNEEVDTKTIDETILEARKLYHQEEDAVKEHLDVSMFDYEDTFQKVQFLDFYRYSDVSLEEMLVFLKDKVDWVRPTDTGRSTNCLINQVGIYVHKKEKGYSNYSFPYSWDVRMGHKTRTETLEEINEVIDEKEVKRIIDEIGYQELGENESNQKKLVGYYTGKKKISSKELASHLKKELPEYMVPAYFKFMEELPLTKNGKVDRAALRTLNTSQLELESPFVAPNGEIEELLAAIWKEVLHLNQVGAQDDFIALGGHSLAAIRVTARINEEVQLKFPLNKVFELPTIAEYAKYVEETLVALME